MSFLPGLRMVGNAPEKAIALTFVLDGCQRDEVGAALDRQGIAVLVGHHCAQPILCRHGLEAAVRPSLAMYNTFGEVDTLVGALCDSPGTRTPEVGPGRRQAAHGRCQLATCVR